MLPFCWWYPDSLSCTSSLRRPGSDSVCCELSRMSPVFSMLVVCPGVLSNILRGPRRLPNECRLLKRLGDEMARLVRDCPSLVSKPAARRGPRRESTRQLQRTTALHKNRQDPLPAVLLARGPVFDYGFSRGSAADFRLASLATGAEKPSDDLRGCGAAHGSQDACGNASHGILLLLALALGSL